MVRDKVTLALTENALSYINANATERKRGEFVSAVLEEYSRIMEGVGELGGDTTGILERIDMRLARMEKQIALMVAGKL
jgi:hypothetical protein